MAGPVLGRLYLVPGLFFYMFSVHQETSGLCQLNLGSSLCVPELFCHSDEKSCEETAQHASKRMPHGKKALPRGLYAGQHLDLEFPASGRKLLLPRTPVSGILCLQPTRMGEMAPLGTAARSAQRISSYFKDSQREGKEEMA